MIGNVDIKISFQFKTFFIFDTAVIYDKAEILYTKASLV